MSTATLPRVNGSSKSLVATYAKFPVMCRLCNKQVERGQAIRYHGKYPNSNRRMWVHYDCHNPAAPLPESPELPADEDLRLREQPEARPEPRPEAQPESSAEVKALSELVAELIGKLGGMERELAEVKAAKPAPREIVVKRLDAVEVKIEGAVHAAFEEVLELAASRENIFLPGPAGCGKSHLARQVAEALGLKFGFISCSGGMSESQLLGRMIPVGDGGQFEFVGTSFLDCYENGGVFLFDEIDAADPNVLLVINAALANGHMAVPARHDQPTAERHPDFVFIAAANTFGKGADRQYSGRNQLDESTLDRLRIGTVPMDYNPELERQLCPDEKLYDRLVKYREAVVANKLLRTVSTRFIEAAYRMRAHGWSIDKIESKLFAGWREDEVRKVRGH